MTPLQLISAGQKLYGRKRWKRKMADALGVDQSTIHRLTVREIVPGPYVVAIPIKSPRHRSSRWNSPGF